MADIVTAGGTVGVIVTAGGDLESCEVDAAASIGECPLWVDCVEKVGSCDA
jgi:hypothetical protein